MYGHLIEARSFVAGLSQVGARWETQGWPLTRVGGASTWPWQGNRISASGIIIIIIFFFFEVSSLAVEATKRTC